MMTLLTLVIAFTPPETAAYPIPPQPLRWLFAEADLVVVGVAGKARSIEALGDTWETGAVDLTIRKVLKGRVDGTKLTVRHRPGMVCPAPDEYPEGQTVLAFLCRVKGTEDWRAPRLSYASKALSDEALSVYEKRIVELQGMEGGRSRKIIDAKVIEWLVKCMEHPATRWEGAYEFETHGLRVKGSEEEPRPASVTLIEQEQWKRLVAAFVKSKECTGGELAMASAVLFDVPDRRIDDVLLRGVEMSLTEDHPWRGESAMKIVGRRIGTDEALKFIRDFEETNFENLASRRAILRSFLDYARKP